MADEEGLTDADAIAKDVADFQADNPSPEPVKTLTDRLKMAEFAFAECRRALVWLGYPKLAEDMDLPIEELIEVLQ